MPDPRRDVFQDNLGQVPEDEVMREVSEQPDIAENEGSTENADRDVLAQREQARINNLNRSP
ncbi:MAG TPA: hypothetical protein VHL09_06075 [Dehalococcoidia bacterium]|nr:hypothetical protein [Dehalococcoidia bacterium]